ncbi:MAG: hypothetical protein UT96_C0043G0004 [Candidatus Woesebacteria bacterium GW2011_GWC2_40_30]|nr:MAG: hypothetical protein UT96_C0043G0004 [Candidatus Woesebacteria bacterium GW2011_GWC2_40_30]
MPWLAACLAGILINPKSTDSIAEGITKVLLAPIAKYNSMKEAGLAQAKKFSWEKTARKTLDIITNNA